jgi:hypothetical protein
LSLLEAGDPHAEVRMTWHAKETVRRLYDIDDPDVEAANLDELVGDMAEPAMPSEVRSLAGTLRTLSTARPATSQRADHAASGASSERRAEPGETPLSMFPDRAPGRSRCPPERVGRSRRLRRGRGCWR